jgi:hypothetical protein
MHWVLSTSLRFWRPVVALEIGLMVFGLRSRGLHPPGGGLRLGGPFGLAGTALRPSPPPPLAPTV